MLQVSSRLSTRLCTLRPTLAFRGLFARHKHSMSEEDYRTRIRAMAVPLAKGPSTKPYALGLTGSIAMGKSTVAAMFRDLGVPVMDSDATVHEMYAEGGAAVPVVQGLFPDAIRDGAVDRAALSAHVLGPWKEKNMERLEESIHPLVATARDNFLSESAEGGEAVVVLDIPLLFEKGLEGSVDAVLVVSAPAAVQRERALARHGMTEEKLQGILQRQVPDDDKRQRASFVIETDKDLNFTRVEIAELVHHITASCSSDASLSNSSVART